LNRLPYFIVVLASFGCTARSIRTSELVSPTDFGTLSDPEQVRMFQEVAEGAFRHDQLLLGAEMRKLPAIRVKDLLSGVAAADTGLGKLVVIQSAASAHNWPIVRPYVEELAIRSPDSTTLHVLSRYGTTEAILSRLVSELPYMAFFDLRLVRHYETGLPSLFLYRDVIERALREGKHVVDRERKLRLYESPPTVRRVGGQSIEEND